MDLIDERELKNLLRGRPPAAVMISTVMKTVLDPNLPWEERRVYWHFLHQTGRASAVAATLAEALTNKIRVPFNVLAAVASEARIKPSKLEISAFTKGLRKQQATADVLHLADWQNIDPKLSEMREALVSERASHEENYKRTLLEKFEFLRNQRMHDQAGRVLKRMLEIYPEEQRFGVLHTEFEEARAREVISDRSERAREKFERTHTVPSTADRVMLKCFTETGIELIVNNRAIAPDLAVALWFLDDFDGAAEILAWAEPSVATDWMRVEVMLAGRRFVECLEAINALEVKYSGDPESTFAAAFARARCLFELGQEATALETLRSLVRIRPNYRSAATLLAEWSEGAEWE